MIGKGRGGEKRQKAAVVPTNSILKAANVPIIGGHHVFALQSSPEERQATRYWSIVENRGSPGARGAAARAVSGRDQRRPGTGVAQVDRGPRGGAAQPRTMALFPRGTLSTDCWRMPRSCVVKLSQLQSAPAAAVGRLLAGVVAVARAAVGPVLGRSACRPAAKGTRWDWCWWSWWPTGCWLRAASGGCTASGFSAARWPDLLGVDFGLAEIHKLYGCHDRLLAHKSPVRSPDGALAGSVRRQLRRAALRSDQHLFRERSAVSDERQAAVRLQPDKRPDCVQVVIALMVTPRAFRWPTRCCRATPPIRRRCKGFSSASSSSTARPGASG